MSGTHPSCFSLTTAFITNLMKLYQAPPTSLPCDVTRDPQGEQDRYGCTNFKELTGRQELNHQREDEHSLGDKRQVQAGVMLAHSVAPPLPGQEEAGGRDVPGGRGCRKGCSDCRLGESGRKEMWETGKLSPAEAGRTTGPAFAMSSMAHQEFCF